MEKQKPNWRKIELCQFFLDLLDSRLSDIEEAISEEEVVETSVKLEESSKDLRYFYMMVFNVAFYEFALAYAEVQEESHKIIDEYLKKKKNGEDGAFGGDDGKVF